MRTAVALFTRDLRVADNPVLAAAAEADRMVALFVLDDAVLAGDFNRPNRAGFLAECLADLRAALRKRGGDLVVRSGATTDQVARLAEQTDATTVHVAGDVSGHAQRREERLHKRLAGAGVELRVHSDALFVVPPGRITPAGRDHMAVFTPYFRRWEATTTRPPVPTPRRLHSVRVRSGRLPTAQGICDGVESPERPAGGEREGRRRMSAWLRGPIDAYADRHDDLAGDATSRLSPYLHFGCLSPHELRARAVDRGGAGADAFVRQLAWRDFHAQVLAARPDAAAADYRTRGDRWRHDPAEFDAWRSGQTGVPIVDAAMRQLRLEGWMHNRARMLVAHFLIKTLYLDWRAGAAHFLDLLVDGDIANNTMNWQWTAGTGTDTRPNRQYNLIRQAHRHDPHGEYVRRYLPELATIPGPQVHEPWRLPPDVRDGVDYPDPIVDLMAARERFRRGRDR
ncbi:MAG TPA: deoxyribodipyrimidine photo-lyase [Nocardioidaceae bacterium]|nr:deoxyribodipyrimidine photo-lyase [Nocardioidaceae bacterium]